MPEMTSWRPSPGVPDDGDGPGRPWRADDWCDDTLAALARAHADDPVGLLAHDASGVSARAALAPLAAALGRDSWVYLAGLATLGAVDLSVARAAEPHVDALAILAQAAEVELGALGVDDASTFGVFAAQAPGRRLSARPSSPAAGDAAAVASAPSGAPDPDAHPDPDPDVEAVGGSRPGPTDPVELHGEKPWCSLASRLTHALVTAAVEPAVEPADQPAGQPADQPAGAAGAAGAQPAEQRAGAAADQPAGRAADQPAGAAGARSGLFAVDLRDERVSVLPSPWVPRGLTAIATQALAFDGAPAVPVGEPGWYLSRPGFAWGGIGVAAVWFGAAAALAGSLLVAARRREPDQIALMHVGHADRVLYGALLALRDAAARIDAGCATGAAGELLAARVRAVVARAAEDVVELAGHALGPAPLTHDETHARRVADLTVYVRQHHAERDLARLGELALRNGDGS